MDRQYNEIRNILANMNEVREELQNMKQEIHAVRTQIDEILQDRKDSEISEIVEDFIRIKV